MNFKKYIGALVFLLSGLGIFSQYNSTKPNQEIVLQFQDEITNSVQPELAIASIKEQLQAIGVHEISISELADGTLKISYFSEAEVSEVKQFLSERLELRLNIPLSDSEKLPSEKNRGLYKVKVSEIQKTVDLPSGFSDKSIILQKSDFERFLNPSHFQKESAVNWSRSQRPIQKIGCLSDYFPPTKIHIPYEIPETRAGPRASII